MLIDDVFVYGDDVDDDDNHGKVMIIQIIPTNFGSPLL